MKKLLKLVGMMAGVLAAVTSCLSSDDVELVFYNDAAITSFYLSSIEIERHTTSSKGGDSIYIETNTDVAYIPFLIDHYAGKIYNVDSLPYGTNTTNMLCYYLAKNNGIVQIKRLPEEIEKDKEETGNTVEWVYLNTTDSIDFTTPRQVKTYAYNDKALTREYTIEVRVKKSNTTFMTWYKAGDMDKVPAVLKNDGAIAYGNAMAVMNGTTIEYYSVDGAKETHTADDIKQLLSMGQDKIYAIGNNGKIMVSANHGKTWAEDILDDDALLLPDANLAAVTTSDANNKGVDYTILVGECSAINHDNMVSWLKMDTGNDSGDKWVLTTDINGSDTYKLPKMTNITVAAVNSGLVLATGKTASGKYEKIYLSRDGGITWKENSAYVLPSIADSADAVRIWIDANGILWLMDNAGGAWWCQISE